MAAALPAKGVPGRFRGRAARDGFRAAGTGAPLRPRSRPGPSRRAPGSVRPRKGRGFPASRAFYWRTTSGLTSALIPPSLPVRVALRRALARGAQLRRPCAPASPSRPGPGVRAAGRRAGDAPDRPPRPILSDGGPEAPGRRRRRRIREAFPAAGGLPAHRRETSGEPAPTPPGRSISRAGCCRMVRASTLTEPPGRPLRAPRGRIRTRWPDGPAEPRPGVRPA
jgi:hypothetical protein